MARTIKEMPPPVRRYPWDLWLNGQRWELQQGEDFRSLSRVFAIHIFTVARRRGIKVDLRQRGPKIYLQALPGAEKATAKKKKKRKEVRTDAD